MKRPYESIVIFDGTLSDDTIASESGKIKEFLSNNTEFEKVEVWGKKYLAYTINKKKSGIYHMFVYTGEGNVAAKLDKFLKLNETVIRHLTVVREENGTKPIDVPAPEPLSTGEQA